MASVQFASGLSVLLLLIVSNIHAKSVQTDQVDLDNPANMQIMKDRLALYSALQQTEDQLTQTLQQLEEQMIHKRAGLQYFGARGKKSDLKFFGARGKKALQFFGARGKKWTGAERLENDKKSLAFYGARG